MSLAPTEIIYPCPFTKAYGIPRQQAWSMLKIFSIYRFVIASLFVMLFYYNLSSVQDTAGQQLYQVISYIYLAIVVLANPFIIRQTKNYASLAQILITTDIFCITLIMHASGGINSGLGIFLTVSIAAGGLLVGGRCAMLFAALATITVLTEQTYAIFTYNFNGDSLTYSGMLGVSFFSTVMLSYILTQRTEQSNHQEKLNSITIARLEELNRYIIQHMQSGIMIVDNQQAIQLVNPAVLRMLEITQTPTELVQVDPILQLAFQKWRTNIDQNFVTLHLQNNKEIQIRFSLINIQNEHLHLLIVEDMALYNQHLQQSKLASLGRLTASIAHEIRNPLSAISHAAQLLPEAAHLDNQDLRLIEIIQQNSLRVDNIIQNILKLSKRNASQKQRIELDSWLMAFFTEQCQSFIEYANNFILEFKTAGINVYIDPSHLSQILDNLFTNALRYGQPERGKILVLVDRINQAPFIKVIDHGPGISLADQQQLFEPFFTTSHQGTGLGLYISKELAELNQAELTYNLQDGLSCFTLTLANADLAVIEL